MAIDKIIEKNKRTALITGSGRNIGRAIAIELAAEGHNIILNGSSDRAACESVAREIESIGSNSKHAAWGLTKSIAKEYGRNGITANIISPGTIVGEVEDSGFSNKLDTLKQQNPAGRLGEPKDIARMVSYLTCDHAGFVNGQLMQVNGGVVV